MAKNLYAIFFLLIMASVLSSQSISYDNTFNGDGKVIVDFSDEQAVFTDMAIQSDGKPVAVGYSDYDPDEVGSSKIWVVRLNPDGTYDQSFGIGGKVEIDQPLSTDVAYSVMIQSDNKIIIAGYSEIGNQMPKPTIYRLNTDGSLDTGYGISGTGIVQLNITAETIFDTDLQNDGKIVFSGYGTVPNARRMLVGRLNINGTLDTSFISPYGYGLYKSGTGNDDEYTGSGIKVQSDGKIVASGTTTSGLWGSRATVVRLLSNGQPDLGFGAAGLGFWESPNTLQPQLYYSSTLNIDKNGRIIVSGGHWINNNDTEYAIFWVLENGNIDLNSGDMGLTKIDLGGNLDDAETSFVLDDDAILVSGISNNNLGILKIKPNGKELDSVFAANGIWLDTIGELGRVNKLIVYGDNIYICGSYMPDSQMPNNFDGFIFRLIAPGISAVKEACKNEKKYSIYPNPASSTLTLIGDLSVVKKIEIININGVLRAEMFKTGSQVDLKNLEAGTYFIRLYYKNNIETHQFSVIKN
ncbi:MAG: T9SS type A sorting domain-containing protein [Saprospiraceae bacterium]|nr:T9SS type A sorting domain-containing protein [Saprospiraceae bacterium]